ncbi:hypothetical protein [Pyruvatibacter mobilis]|uniref:hypothetical protein n=1 Tax=Pyruvatibacter mobilis TaxID=1712261 RepID=UPI003C7B8303
MVGILFNHRPAFLLGAQPTHAKLIRDRRVALIVGRIAGVECDSHARASSVGEAVTRQSGRLLLDEITCGLPGDLADKIDEAGVRFLGLGHARHGLIAGLGDQSKLRGCGLPLPSHPRPAS